MCYPYAVQVHPWANTEASHAPTHILCKVLGNLMTIFTKIVKFFLHNLRLYVTRMLRRCYVQMITLQFPSGFNMYLIINACITALNLENFSQHYLHNCSTLDIVVFGYTDVNSLINVLSKHSRFPQKHLVYTLFMYMPQNEVGQLSQYTDYRDGWPRNCGSISSKGKRLFLFSKVYYVALGTTQLLSVDTGGCYPRVKAVG
jgi:hypothetical protein